MADPTHSVTHGYIPVENDYTLVYMLRGELVFDFTIH